MSETYVRHRGIAQVGLMQRDPLIIFAVEAEPEVERISFEVRRFEVRLVDHRIEDRFSVQTILDSKINGDILCQTEIINMIKHT